MPITRCFTTLFLFGWSAFSVSYNCELAVSYFSLEVECFLLDSTWSSFHEMMNGLSIKSFCLQNFTSSVAAQSRIVWAGLVMSPAMKTNFSENPDDVERQKMSVARVARRYSYQLSITPMSTEVQESTFSRYCVIYNSWLWTWAFAMSSQCLMVLGQL